MLGVLVLHVSLYVSLYISLYISLYMQLFCKSDIEPSLQVLVLVEVANKSSANTLYKKSGENETFFKLNLFCLEQKKKNRTIEIHNYMTKHKQKKILKV